MIFPNTSVFKMASWLKCFFQKLPSRLCDGCVRFFLGFPSSFPVKGEKKNKIESKKYPCVIKKL